MFAYARQFIALKIALCFIIGLIVAISYAAVVPTAQRPPNIIFILADDLGYGDLGSYGQKKLQTPHLDRLAAEGMRFSQFYAGSAVCAPSRSVLMTGLHTGHTPIRGNKGVKPMGQKPLPAETLTVAGLLKKAGYATGLVGKWGLGGPGSTGIPKEQGFDYFYGYLCQRHAHNYYPEFLFRNEERVPLKNRVAQPRPDGAGVAIERAQYSHDLLIQQALAFVERHKERPFFLYLALTIPHANNEAGPKGMEVPDYGPYADRDWPEPQKGHAAMISRMDADIGRLVGLLKTRGLDASTIIFFSSDNGPHSDGGVNPEFADSNGPLRGFKAALYEGGIRVPMIVRWPGRIPAGQASDQVWAFWDFLPTAAEIAGVKPPAQIDGISMLPTLLGWPQKQQHEFLYWEFPGRDFSQAVRMGQWKAVRFGTKEPLELYNLNDDLREQYNIADRHPEVIRKIEAYLAQARTEAEDWPARGHRRRSEQP
jgi:arylsulfatase A-like enzyme